MNAIADTQARALMARVREQATRAAEELRATTRAECLAIERRARREAHARLRAAVMEKRRRIAARCQAVDIECEAERRHVAFAQAARLAEQALGALPDALAARWERAESRRAWCSAAAGIAAGVLRAREWIVELAPGAGDVERGLVEQSAAARGAVIREWLTSQEPCGLRIGRESTWVDATVGRLLADRTWLAAQLLAELANPTAPS